MLGNETTSPVAEGLGTSNLGGSCSAFLPEDLLWAGCKGLLKGHVLIPESSGAGMGLNCCVREL